MSTYGAYKFDDTTIGHEWNETGRNYPTDNLLDYLFQMMTLRDESETYKLRKECENEIEAVKEIMQKQNR